jgi:hypothetical protein
MIILNSHFISQSSPDIRKSLSRQRMALRPPQGDLMKMAFKVFNNREEA